MICNEAAQPESQKKKGNSKLKKATSRDSVSHHHSSVGRRMAAALGAPPAPGEALRRGRILSSRLYLDDVPSSKGLVLFPSPATLWSSSQRSYLFPSSVASARFALKERRETSDVEQMRIPSRSSVLHLLRRPNLALSTLLPPMQRRLPSRPLLYAVASAPSRMWPPAVAPNRAARRVSRIPHGSRNMVSSSGVKGEEFEPERRHLAPANDPIRIIDDTMISLGEQFAITKDMNNVENMGAMDEFVARYGVEGACRSTVEGTDGTRDAEGATVDVDVKQDAWRETEFTSCRDVCHGDCKEDTRMGDEVSDGKEYASCSGEEEVPCYEDACLADLVDPLVILEHSIHRDGSIYKGTRKWQQDYRIAD